MKLTIRKSCTRSLVTLGLAIAAVCCCSCSKLQHRTCYPVEGRVLFQGKPATGAMVFFHPREAHDPNDEYFEPAGIVEPDGRFRLSTYETEEGAPAGEYSVTIRQKNAQSDEELSSAWPQRYESPVTSGLNARVLTGPTQLEPFHLTNAPYELEGSREMRRGR